MKIGIIGAGNMGGAIAKGLAKGTMVKASDLIVANPSQGKLDMLKLFNSAIQVTHNNCEAAAGVDIVIIAVKPWLVDAVLKEIKFDPAKQLLISVAAGIPFSDYLKMLGVSQASIFRIIPNTAISEGESMNLIAVNQASEEQKKLVKDIFDELGYSLFVDEKQMGAGTALTSCGIAYVFKYIQAAMQAGVELGLRPKDAQKMVAQSLKGAAAIILNNDTHPSVEIDKVTTPGGFTIRGLNELEHSGFTSAVIKAMKASL
jgi:pyrroline-5-carboxylate reductase